MEIKMFPVKHDCTFTRLCGRFTGVVCWVVFGIFTATAQSTTPAPLANPNPNNFDSAKIMAAFATPHSDLTLISAHRGIHALAGLSQTPGVPENSIEAIGLAAQEGWETIEIDVRVTSDGVPILSHDRTWGREWCGLSPFPGSYIYSPFIPAGQSNANDAANPGITATSLSNTRSFLGQTVLRDSVSIVTSVYQGCPAAAKFYGVYPPTLQDVYDYIRNTNIQAVLILDVQSEDAIKAAWAVTQGNVDAQGRPSWQSTIYKMPAGLFPHGPSDYLAMFPNNPGQVNFIPVIVGGAVAPPADNVTTLDGGDDAGFDESSVGTTGFGSEQNIIYWLQSMEGYSPYALIHVLAVEVVMKEPGGLLQSVLTAARNNPYTHQPMNVGNFNPIGEYYPPDDSNTNQTPQFFRSSDGSCCDVLAKYLYNNPNGTGPIDPSQPIEHADNRTSLDFINGSGNTFVTTDDPNRLAGYLTSNGLYRRNLSYMQADGGASENSNVPTVSLSATPMSPSPGTNVQLSVVLSRPSATGTVTFYENGASLGTAPVIEAFANFTVTALAQGTHTFNATYSGDSTYSSGQSNSVTVTAVSSSGGGSANPSTCDIYASGGTPCVAAHSTVRGLFGAYNGRLYQVRRASDGATTDIGTLTAGGYANASAQDSFCAGTSCTITMIYDQSSYNNGLSIEGPGGTVQTADSGASANALPISVNGNAVYGVRVTPGVGYRNNATSGVAKGGSPEGMYMVTSGTYVNNGCCFDYGNAETSGNDTGNGHMDALNFGTACVFGPCSGSGPWVEADLENGQYMGNGSNLANQSIGSDFVTAMLKNNGQTTFALKGGNAQSGGLTTEYAGSLPTINPGYTPMSLEGAVVLGTGGDNSNWGLGSFFEGAMTSGYPSDAVESAVQANIVAAGYTGNSGGNGGSSGGNGSHPDNGGSVYTGPNDPGGPGPQDGFASPAIQQPNIYMGSKPALASFNGSLYVAFQANDPGHTLHVTSSSDGQTFPAASQKPNIQMGSAPAMAEFNNQLFIAFQANDPVNELWLTSSPDGSSFTSATGYPNILMGGAPAMAVFKSKLYLAFQANDAGHTLHVTSSSDGQTWPAATQVPNVAIGSAPAMAVFNGKLYVAFRADDPSNAVWIASSLDGVNFSSQKLSSQSMGGSSSPALVVSNNTLYYIYGADDTSNEMLVTASTDGSTWQGPAAYLDVKMGAAGPGAAAFGNGVYMGLQSNDSRNALYVTHKATEASVYTGPNDPGGPGPQDGFASPAIQQPNIYMGSKPALTYFNKSLYVAFQANDTGHTLQVTSSSDGQTFPAASQKPNIQIGSAPTMAAFNNRLFIAFQANDPVHELWLTSSSDGSSFTSATGYPNILMGSAPAMVAFNNALYVAFQANDPGHTLHVVSSSSDGQTWPAATQVPNIAMGSAPAMAVFNGKLYVAFRADDPSNAVWIASSSDGVHFSSQVLSGQTMGGSSVPALTVLNSTLYYIYGANDISNEMLVTASTDGSTWQGPAAYLDVKMGAAGPAASAFGNGVYVGFQSNDSRKLLFVTHKAIAALGP